MFRNNPEKNLLSAMKKKNFAAVKKIIDEHLNDTDFLNRINFNGSPLFVWLAANNQTDLVCHLLQHTKINPNAVDSDRKSALIRAVQLPNFTMVNALLADARVDIDLKDNKNFTAIMYAGNGLSSFLKHPKVDWFQWMLSQTIITLYHAQVSIPDIFNRLTAEQQNVVRALFYKHQTELPYSILGTVGYGQIFIDLMNLELIDINYMKAQNGLPQTPLSEALTHGNDDSALTILKQPQCNIHLPVYEYSSGVGTPLLCYLADRSLTKFIDVVLKKPGVNVNVSDKNGDTPLIHAVRVGRIDVVEMLLACDGIDVHAVNTSKQNALTIAVQFGRQELVKLLQLYMLRHEAKDQSGAAIDYKQLFIDAVEKGVKDVARELLMRPDFDVNATYLDRWNGPVPLLTFIMRKGIGYIDLLNIALNKTGIKMDAADNHGNTALMAAVPNAHIDLIKTLLACKIFPLNAVNHNGESALLMALKIPRLDIIKVLLAEKNINVDIVKREGSAALIEAVKKGDLEAIAALLATGADMHAVDKTGKSALQYAANTPVLPLLMKEFMQDVNRVDHQGKTPIMHAVIQGNLELLEKMLAQDASSVNAQDNEGNTALIYAATLYDNAHFVKTLLKYGADPFIANRSKNFNAIEAAMAANHMGLVYSLQNPNLFFAAPSAPPASDVDYEQPPQPSAPPAEEPDCSTASRP